MYLICKYKLVFSFLFCRSVTLDDAARFIDHHSLINRTVYDLDVLTDANAMGSLTHQSLPSTSDSSGAVEPCSGKESEEWSKAVEGASSRTDEIINSVDGVCQLHDSIPPLEFESRFESGNLRKAIQVIFSTNMCSRVFIFYMHRHYPRFDLMNMTYC